MELPKDYSKNLVDLEILISTMFRTNLHFLEEMFDRKEGYKNYHILIVNQTDQDKLLTSSYPNIRVLNSFERGTSKSRNLAIQNAIGEVCLMADDDINYVTGFKNIILNNHQLYDDIDFISFEAIDDNLNPFTAYPKTGNHSKKTLRSIYTIVITFKRINVINAGALYNEHFGLNTTFNAGEEYVFLRNAYDRKMKLFHVKKVIVKHSNITSGRFQYDDSIVFSKAALKFRYIRTVAYLWLIKYIFFLFRKKYISINEMFHKFSQGLKGIQKYKELDSSGKI